MNRERAKELLPVIQAYAEGKQIETNTRYSDSDWISCPNPTWQDGAEYRIKPEPLECWVCVTESGHYRFVYESPPNNMLQGDKLYHMREVTD